MCKKEGEAGWSCDLQPALPHPGKEATCLFPSSREIVVDRGRSDVHTVGGTHVGSKVEKG